MVSTFILPDFREDFRVKIQTRTLRKKTMKRILMSKIEQRYVDLQAGVELDPIRLVETGSKTVRNLIKLVAGLIENKTYTCSLFSVDLFSVATFLNFDTETCNIISKNSEYSLSWLRVELDDNEVKLSIFANNPDATDQKPQLPLLFKSTKKPDGFLTTTPTRPLFDFTLDNPLEIIAAAIHHKKSGTPMEITAKGIYLGKRDTVTATLFVTELFTYVSSGCQSVDLIPGTSVLAAYNLKTGLAACLLTKSLEMAKCRLNFSNTQPDALQKEIRRASKDKESIYDTVVLRPSKSNPTEYLLTHNALETIKPFLNRAVYNDNFIATVSTVAEALEVSSYYRPSDNKLSTKKVITSFDYDIFYEYDLIFLQSVVVDPRQDTVTTTLYSVKNGKIVAQVTAVLTEDSKLAMEAGEIKIPADAGRASIDYKMVGILASKAVKFLRKNPGKKVVIEHEHGGLFDTEILRGNLDVKYVKDYPVITTQVSKITLESLDDGTIVTSVEKPGCCI